jgi:tetratricopeptide (TPR) repeat protein
LPDRPIDPEDQEIPAQFEQNLEEHSAELADHLRPPLDTDDTLVKELSEAPRLPPSVYTEVSGSYVEKLIQIAKANLVQIVFPPPQRPKPFWFWAGLAGVAVIIIGGLILAWLLLSQLPPMPGGFNVAVAEFTMLNDDERITSTDVSQDLSVWLFEAIKKETDQLPASLRVNTRGPDEVGIVQGEDRDTRAANAAQVATRHNATILIYGVVTPGENGYQVEPEFYVSDQGFGYGSEVAGPDRLGQPVSFTLPLEPGEQVDINQKLHARTRALQDLVAGLAYFYIGRYEEARAKFQHAADVKDWRPEEGKETAYLLVGAANLRLFDQASDPARRDQALGEASEAFAQASQINPEYARSYLGLGAVAFQQARMRDPEGKLAGQADEAKLIEARDWYTTSLAASDQPTSAYVRVKAAYGLGQVHLEGFEQGFAGWSGAEAWHFFERVVAAYKEEPVPDLAWFAAHAHAHLGRLAGHNRDWETMSTEYREAIDTLGDMAGDSNHNWIGRYWAWVAFAEEKLNRPSAARDAYREAIRFGEGNVPPAELEEWQNQLDRLEKGLS